MKDLRQELIDFMKWKVGDPNNHLFTEIIENEVDRYLKSINSAQAEALSVGNNEQAKEICTACLGTGGRVIYDTYFKCKECGGTGAK